MHFMSEEFQGPIDEFVDMHCHIFKDQAALYADVDFDYGGAERKTAGHSLRQYEVYQGFISLRLLGFCSYFLLQTFKRSLIGS